jgi:hypothetical protein
MDSGKSVHVWVGGVQGVSFGCCVRSVEQPRDTPKQVSTIH